jgi:PAS domain S-box-containing protein
LRIAPSLRYSEIAFGILIASLSVLGGVFVWGSARVDKNLEVVVARRWHAVRHAVEAEQLASQNNRLDTSILLLGDTAEISRLAATRGQNSERISALLAEIETLLGGEKARAAHARIAALQAPYLASYRHALDLLGQQDGIEEAHRLLATETTRLFDEYQQAWRELILALDSEMDEASKAALGGSRRLRVHVEVLFGVAVLLAVAVTALAVRRQKREERKRLEVEEALAAANASLEERVRERTDEMEQTSAILRKTNYRLKAVLADQERQAADLKANQEKLQKLFLAVEQASEAILIADPSGVIEYVNPAFESLTGYSLYEVVGQTPRVLKSGYQTPELYVEMWRTIKAGNVWRGRMVNRKKDGSTYHEDVTISPIRENGRVVNFVSVGRDVTREVGLEGQLLQAQKLEAVGRLAAGVAHEINTPAQFVADNTHFMRDSFADLKRVVDGLTTAAAEQGAQPGDCLERLREALADADLEYLMTEIPKAIDQSLEGLERITKIVAAMKDFSHQGSGEKKPFDLNRAIESTVTISRNEWKYVAEMELHLDPELPQVPIVVNEMNQVFLNLIVNAAHAISDATDGGNQRKGTINIETRREGEMVEIRICDDGAGIPANVRHRIFEPFFTTKPVGKGTGQGLSLSRAIVVEKHQGRLRFESEEGRGTTFIISLPFVPEHAEGGLAS